MDAEQTPASANQRAYYRAMIFAAITAAVISIGLTKLAVSLLWPHPTAISFGLFIFLIPVLPPLFGDKRPRNWPQTLTFGAVAGVIAGYVQTLLD